MSYNPYLTIQGCEENAVDADYLDITFEGNSFSTTPNITATTNTNVSVFVSNITTLGCRLNFSQKYTGIVYVTAMVMG
jgi:hypothetical protein